MPNSGAMPANPRPESAAPVVREYGADTLDSAPPMSPYVAALVREGPGAFLDNARVEARVLEVDDVAVPLVICEPGAANGDVCSPYAHYILYTLEELIKRHPRIPAWAPSACLLSIGRIYQWFRIDRVVYVNNWLFATNPYQPFSRAQLDAMTRRLTERYPSHAIVFRTVNPTLHRDDCASLFASGFQMVKARKVYLLNPESRQFKDRENARLDLRLLEKSPYEVVGDEGLLGPDMSRLEALFRGLYLGKHSRLNPQFNRHFFEFTSRHGVLIHRALRKDGRIDGFASFYIDDRTLTGAFLGYDMTLPRKLGLYRQAIALLIREARDRGLLLNLSAGAGRFKELRGAEPCCEYDAVYMKHLPPLRRLPWRLAQLQGKAW